MNVLQWPETSTPSMTSLSWVFRFSGRMSDSSWIGMDAPSAQAGKVFDDDGRAVGGLEPRAPLLVDAVESQQAAHVHHRLGGIGEIGAQVAAALLVDVVGVDLGEQEVDEEHHVAIDA